MPIGDHLLTQRATIEVASIAKNTQGEEVETWSVYASDVPCLIRPASRPSDVPLAFAATVTHVLYLGYDATLHDGRRYRFLIPIGGVTHTWVASSVDDPGHRQDHLEALVRRLD